MRKAFLLTIFIFFLTSPTLLCQKRVATCGSLVETFVYCITFISDSGVGYNLGADDPNAFDGFDYDDTIFISAAILTGYATPCFARYAIVTVDRISYCDSCCFERGDVNGIGKVNILDLNYTVNYIFRNGLGPPCEGQADVNSDGESANILDLNFLVNYIFRQGPFPEPCPS